MCLQIILYCLMFFWNKTKLKKENSFFWIMASVRSLTLVDGTAEKGQMNESSDPAVTGKWKKCSFSFKFYKNIIKYYIIRKCSFYPLKQSLFLLNKQLSTTLLFCRIFCSIKNVITMINFKFSWCFMHLQTLRSFELNTVKTILLNEQVT